MDNRPAARIGKYEIISKIAQGGMGALYKAKHPTLGMVVLLKRLSIRGGSQVVERFKREARIMMEFKNEHIVQVHDHFKEGPHYFIVEEYVDGISLDKLIRRERYLSSEAATLIVYETAKALKYAHDKKVIHRDIKPANIIISRQGDLKLVDFGIALSKAETTDGLTQEGMTLGTPAYIPPEQIESAKDVDKRADIYSLGVVLYEMLTGKTPFGGSFTAHTMRQIEKGKYVPAHRLNPKASRFLVRISRKCMKVKPRRRYQDLGTLIRALERRIKRRDPESIRLAVKRILAGKDIKDIFTSRRRWLIGIVTAAPIVVVLAGGGAYLYNRGYVYEYLAADRYGALTVSAQLPASYKDPEEVFFEPVLYRETGDQLERLPNVDFAVHKDAQKSTEESLLLASNRIYLPEGRYRLKVNLEGQLYWRSFQLAPRTVQRRLLSTLDGMEETVRLEAVSAPLGVHVTATAADTGADVTPLAETDVSMNGRTLPGTEELRSDATYRFVVSAPGYFPQSFDVIVKPYQTQLAIEANLTPHQAALSIDSTVDGLFLLLNGSEYYSTGGESPQTKRLEPMGVASAHIVLAPGAYTLTARRFASSQTFSFQVKPDESVNVRIAETGGEIHVTDVTPRITPQTGDESVGGHETSGERTPRENR